MAGRLAPAAALVCLVWLPASLCGCSGSGFAPAPSPRCTPPTPAPSRAVPAEGAGATTVLVGSAGCDVEDTACKDDKTAETKIVSLGVDGEGALRNQQQCWNVPGLPAWFALREAAAGKREACLFVVYPDTSSVGAFRIGDRGEMSEVGSMTTKGVNPVHADVTSDGRHLVVANYHGPDDTTSDEGAGVESFSISADCGLEFADWKGHAGGSQKVPGRQGAAHVHSAVAWKQGLVFVSDLGMDKVFTYRVEGNGSLSELSVADTAPGFGPRHSVPHPTEPLLFVLGEMGNAVESYRIEEATGELTRVASIPSTSGMDAGSATGSKAGEVVISPDGLYLYASNRAFVAGLPSTIAVFKVVEGGTLQLVEQKDCPSFPRGVAMMPDGKALLVASQTDGRVVLFKVDQDSGRLIDTDSSQDGPLGAAAFAILPKATILPKVTVAQLESESLVARVGVARQ